MAAQPTVFGQFCVSSGSICFGDLLNIYAGASILPVQGFPFTEPKRSGTVAAQDIKYSMPAEEGQWNVYKLVYTGSKRVVAWFACHEETVAEQEIQKILRVSGSPYEEDSGSSFNDDKTRAEGVLVINRYDWSYYKPAPPDVEKAFKKGDEDLDDEDDEDLGYAAVGLVDYSQAKAQALAWKTTRSAKRKACNAGVWMHTPDSEYMFGRFGFNDAQTLARSFLFFTADTEFDRTSLAGLPTPLRAPETDEE